MRALPFMGMKSSTTQNKRNFVPSMNLGKIGKLCSIVQIQTAEIDGCGLATFLLAMGNLYFLVTFPLARFYLRMTQFIERNRINNHILLRAINLMTKSNHSL
jgi:hypothetical protein